MGMKDEAVLHIYGGPGPLSHDFKIWPTTFQGSGPKVPMLLSCKKIIKIFIFHKTGCQYYQPCNVSIYIWPCANKDSYCWGQDIPNNIFKSIEYIRLSSCIFKMIGPEENMLKISWQSGVPSRSYQQ